MEQKLQEQEQINELNIMLKNHPYKPICKISYGSYGEIFKIIGIQNAKQYALKVISKQRMIKEQKLHQAVIQNILLKKLRHPGVVKYVQTIETPQLISHVIELCPYGDLNQVVKKINKSIEMSFIKEQIIHFYISQLVDALDFIHSQGIIHRDLKLENVLVGPDLNCRLIDFGTAKSINQERTYSKSQLDFISKIRQGYNNQENAQRTKSFVGSANYLAPESIGLEYSLKSDIWSLGIMIYKIYHGKLPFKGQNNFQIFNQIKSHSNSQQIQINVSLSNEIKDLISKCLHPNPQQRPSSSQIKKHPYFSKVNFDTIFTKKSPIDPKALLNTDIKLQKNLQKIHFQLKLEKKMLLGNFKPRILKIYPDKSGNKLLMSYWHIDGVAPKNEFEIRLGDNAQKVSKTQFLVINGDVKYRFRVKDSNIEAIVHQINEIISKHYQS